MNGHSWSSLVYIFNQAFVALAPRLAHRRLEGCERALQLLELCGCRRSRLLRLGKQLLLQRQRLGEARESLVAQPVRRSRDPEGPLRRAEAAVRAAVRAAERAAAERAAAVREAGSAAAVR